MLFGALCALGGCHAKPLPPLEARVGVVDHDITVDVSGAPEGGVTLAGRAGCSYERWESVNWGRTHFRLPRSACPSWPAQFVLEYGDARSPTNQPLVVDPPKEKLALVIDATKKWDSPSALEVTSPFGGFRWGGGNEEVVLTVDAPTDATVEIDGAQPTPAQKPAPDPNARFSEEKRLLPTARIDLGRRYAALSLREIFQPKTQGKRKFTVPVRVSRPGSEPLTGDITIAVDWTAPMIWAEPRIRDNKPSPQARPLALYGHEVLGGDGTVADVTHIVAKRDGARRVVGKCHFTTATLPHLVEDTVVELRDLRSGAITSRTFPGRAGSCPTYWQSQLDDKHNNVVDSADDRAIKAWLEAQMRK